MVGSTQCVHSGPHELHHVPADHVLVGVVDVQENQRVLAKTPGTKELERLLWLELARKVDVALVVSGLSAWPNMAIWSSTVKHALLPSTGNFFLTSPQGRVDLVF